MASNPDNPFLKFRILKRIQPSVLGHVFSSACGAGMWPRSDIEIKIAQAAADILPFSGILAGEDLQAYLNLCEDLWGEAYGKSV